MHVARICNLMFGNDRGITACAGVESLIRSAKHAEQWSGLLIKHTMNVRATISASNCDPGADAHHDFNSASGLNREWAASTGGDTTVSQYRCEVTAFAISFCPVSEIPGGPLSPPSSHCRSNKYPIPTQGDGNVLKTLL
ncbi:hypothetical protein EVAR_79083_1 [Eumeta japonica]|uniref:Uncharacterized protein n=1 Tax=Eumeta variegata TaxID=151549 RepID=A0A4C1X3S3_EUMVA|nr:hypothetical protein EVAR_79083_1 [Eumeta japonica]